MQFDTVVVGASFSGLVTALRAAEAGTVGIVDRRQRPGSPVNTTGAVPIGWLAKMKLIPPKFCIATETRGMEIVAPGGESIKFTGAQPGGYVLYPDLFTSWLLERAQDMGCTYFPDTTATSLVKERHDGRGNVVGVNTSRGEFRGKVVVGADGHSSNIGTWTGLTKRLRPQDTHVGLEYVVENDGSQHPAFFKLWFGVQIAPLGYAWSFPEGEDRLRVGVGIPISVGASPMQYLDRFRSKHPELGGRAIRKEGGVIPTAPPLKTAVSNNVLVVGDAGRFCSPLHGGGIWFGMWSGRLAGDAIVAGDPRLYDQLWKQALGGVLARHYKLKKWIYALRDSDYDKLVAIFNTYQTNMSNPDTEFSAALLHAIAKDPAFVLKTAIDWVKVGLIFDAFHRVLAPKFRIA